MVTGWSVHGVHEEQNCMVFFFAESRTTRAEYTMCAPISLKVNKRNRTVPSPWFPAESPPYPRLKDHLKPLIHIKQLFDLAQNSYRNAACACEYQVTLLQHSVNVKTCSLIYITYVNCLLVQPNKCYHVLAPVRFNLSSNYKYYIFRLIVTII